MFLLKTLCIFPLILEILSITNIKHFAEIEIYNSHEVRISLCEAKYHISPTAKYITAKLSTKVKKIKFKNEICLSKFLP